MFEAGTETSTNIVDREQCFEAVLEALRGPGPLGNVSRVNDHPCDTRVLQAIGGERFEDAPRPIPVTSAELHELTNTWLLERRGDGWGIVWMNQTGEVHPLQGGRWEAKHAFDSWTDVAHRRVRLDDRSDVYGVLDEDPELLVDDVEDLSIAGWFTAMRVACETAEVARGRHRSLPPGTELGAVHNQRVQVQLPHHALYHAHALQR